MPTRSKVPIYPKNLPVTSHKHDTRLNLYQREEAIQFRFPECIVWFNNWFQKLPRLFGCQFYQIRVVAPATAKDGLDKIVNPDGDEIP